MKTQLQTGALVLGTMGLLTLSWLGACTTRGTVRDYAARPIQGADVVLYDNTGPAYVAKTDKQGNYWITHRPRARSGRRMAICAPGMMPMVDSAASALFTTEWGLRGRLHAHDVWLWPDELKSRRDLPVTCQVPAGWGGSDGVPNGSRLRWILAVCGPGRDPLLTRSILPEAWRADGGLSASSPVGT